MHGCKLQEVSDKDLPQYLYNEFSNAAVRLKNSTTQTLKMNYNLLSGKMVFERDGKLYDLINPESIDTVYMQNSKFVRFGNTFYELVLTKPLTLLIENNAKLISVGKPAGYGSTSQTSSVETLSGINSNDGFYNLKLPSDYTVNIHRVYWLMKNTGMLSFVNLKQLIKIFPDKETDIKEYVKKNHISIDRRDDLIKLVQFCAE